MKQIVILCLFFQFLGLTAFAQQFKYHIVEAGETVEEIARKYNTNKETIFKYNPDARNGITPNSKLVVPLGEAQETVQAVPTENVEFIKHRVKRQETIWRLSQDYNVSEEDIKRYNKHLYSEELRRGEVIRIPTNLVEEQSLTQVPADDKFQKETTSVNPMDLTVKEHVVLPQDTKYGISRKYNITIAELERLNPTLDILQPGMILNIRNGNLEKVVDVEGELFKYYLVKPQETIFSLTQRFGISRDSLEVLNPALQEGLKSGMVLRVPNLDAAEDLEAYAEADIVNLERRITNYRRKNIALMLPFNLNRVQTTDTSSNAQERVRRDKVMQLSLDFYSGVLMAIDSAKSLGISTDLRVYDTEQNRGKVISLISINNFSDVDAVIGPILQDQVEAAASALSRYNVPVISPLTRRDVNNRDNFFQAMPTSEMLRDAMISYLSERAQGKNLVLIADGSAVEARRKLTTAFPGIRVITPREGSYISQDELAQALVPERPNWVILESDKIGVISNATSYLNSLANERQIKLFTTNRNSSFDSDNVSHRHLSKLNFHYPSVEKEFSALQSSGFIRKYREKYGVIPNTYAVRGFDVTYDILLRLSSAENLKESVEGEGTTQYVENKFDYDRKPSGGYFNKAVYIMAYGDDMKLHAVQ